MLDKFFIQYDIRTIDIEASSSQLTIKFKTTKAEELADMIEQMLNELQEVSELSIPSFGLVFQVGHLLLLAITAFNSLFWACLSQSLSSIVKPCNFQFPLLGLIQHSFQHKSTLKHSFNSLFWAWVENIDCEPAGCELFQFPLLGLVCHMQYVTC